MTDTQISGPQNLVPHLVVAGADAAIAFYRTALGATELMRLPSDDGVRLMHAELLVNGAKVYLHDDFPEHRGSHSETAPSALGGTSVTLHLEVPDCDAAVKRAADAGATVTLAPWDSFWGARYAKICDPFGHSWSFAHPLPGTPG